MELGNCVWEVKERSDDFQAPSIALSRKGAQNQKGDLVDNFYSWEINSYSQ